MKSSRVFSKHSSKKKNQQRFATQLKKNREKIKKNKHIIEVRPKILGYVLCRARQKNCSVNLITQAKITSEFIDSNHISEGNRFIFVSLKDLSSHNSQLAQCEFINSSLKIRVTLLVISPQRCSKYALSKMELQLV
ncbi:hypothetical protein CsatA_005448 [Cannabis sativa]